MALLNVNLNLLAYLSSQQNTNPSSRLFDVVVSMKGLATDLTKTEPFALAPGETKTVMSFARSISYNGSTSFSIAPVSGGSKVRLTGSYGARTARADGDGTTQWVVSLSGTVMRLTYGGTGTSPTFGGMSAGDGLTIEQDNTAFNSANRGDWTISKVGANYVEVQNPLAVGETVVGQVQIYSSGPVQVGDILDVSSTAFSKVNRGQFTIERVTDSYVEFTNALAVSESSLTGVAASGVAIYSDLFKWCFVQAAQRVVVRLNGASDDSCEVEPVANGDIENSPGVFLKRGKVHTLVVYNPTDSEVEGFCFFAE